MERRRSIEPHGDPVNARDSITLVVATAAACVIFLIWKMVNQ